MHKANESYHGQIVKIEESNIRIQKSIVEVKKKAVQANQDKIELLRDLATYEVNFSDIHDYKNQLISVLGQVGDTQSELRKSMQIKKEDLPLLHPDQESNENSFHSSHQSVLPLHLQIQASSRPMTGNSQDGENKQVGLLTDN
mmetsp:Transcript_20643/g.31476  ORF Transcript_20643/g.31476 Transcript_20643/m.31476 type:complete len:143 (+) Transcript_20643:2229-2657(+)